MPPIKGSFHHYAEEAMREAINDVRINKTPVHTTAKKYGVPRITLKYKVEGKSPIGRKMGPKTILSLEEETILAKKKELEKLKRERAAERERKKEEKMKHNEEKIKINQKGMKPKAKKQTCYEDFDTQSSISIPDDSDGEGSDWNEDSYNEDEPGTIEKDDFVIGEYEGKYYPGKIMEVIDDVFEIDTMVQSGISTYRWPVKEDKLIYMSQQTKRKINRPKLCTRRGSYLIPEMNTYSVFRKL